MTINQSLAINPEIKGLLTSLDFFGFDTLGQCVKAIIQHSDWASRWEVETLDQQRTIEIWRDAVIEQAIDLLILC